MDHLRRGLDRNHRPLTGTGIAVACIAASYALFVLVTGRGDLAGPAFVHATVACAVVGIVSLARRTNSAVATMALLLVAVVVTLVWVYLAFIGLLLFGCGVEGCFA
jgi:hypothetical protein